MVRLYVYMLKREEISVYRDSLGDASDVMRYDRRRSEL